MKIHLFKETLNTTFFTDNVIAKCYRKVKYYHTRKNCYSGEESLFCKHCLNKIKYK